VNCELSGAPSSRSHTMSMPYRSVDENGTTASSGTCSASAIICRRPYHFDFATRSIFVAATRIAGAPADRYSIICTSLSCAPTSASTIATTAFSTLRPSRYVEIMCRHASRSPFEAFA
jgi:hypothetical protein